MSRTDIRISHGTVATIVVSTDNVLTFDTADGKNMKQTRCICTFLFPEGFFDDLNNAKILSVIKDSIAQIPQGKYSSSSFDFIPQFGYTNEKFEEILFSLFEKYKL